MAYSGYRTRARCSCFSTCTRQSTATFLAGIPDSIESRASPWHSYLTVVYGRPPRLPFNLSSLNFFYHADWSWPSSVEWPMSPCRWRDGYQTMSAVPSPLCPEATCSRWRRPRARLLSADAFATQLLPNDEGSTRGVAIFAALPSGFYGMHRNATSAQLVAAASPLLGHSPTPSFAWMEVIRMSPRALRINRNVSVEGTANYGCWFWPARGSNIWLNTGRSSVLHTKHWMRALEVEWRAQDGRRDVTKLVSPHNEHFTTIAGDLGYSTDQCQFTRMRTLAELVVTTAGCMRSLVPAQACAPGVDLRVGWRQERPCKCNPRSIVVSCHK